ncbi:MAG: HD domain-containing protein, partial [candidate division Zixibacteria bacterium]|nr:HD domain-containing protein [candidate division Zixibacteria bacterium]
RVMSFDYAIYSHSVNVCTFSLALAQAAGMDSTKELTELGTGALLHDVGKIRISDSILNKRGSLDETEMETVRHHPQWGVEIIQETNLIPEVSYLPIRQHHEREDSSGYPDGADSDNVHIFSKIVAIADVFDAMTTERVYRHAVGAFPALKTMFTEKNAFDRNLLQLFTRLLGPTDLVDL